MSVLRAGAHECQIRSAPVLGLPSLQRFSITLKRRQRAKIKFILALCQQSKTLPRVRSFEVLYLFHPFSMEDAFFICTLIRMCAEVVTLCLN
ncbi:hypothetical protein EVS87_011100 [Bacillus altitudinis]|nr:hypothetical protein EVS87_011100 [Bacillus altitudinis]